MSAIGIDDLGYDEKLYILAFDHRGSFEKMVGVTGEDADADKAKVTDAKTLIWEGFQKAVRGLEIDKAGRKIWDTNRSEFLLRHYKLSRRLLCSVWA